MKEVYAIKKSSHDFYNNENWYDTELFESEDDAIAILTLEAGRHIDDQGFTWDGKDLTWTFGNWSYDWRLDKIPVVESGAIVSDLQNIGIKVKKKKPAE